MMFTTLRQSLRWGFRPSWKGQTRRRSTHPTRLRLHCEALEGRALLSVSSILGFNGLDHTANPFDLALPTRSARLGRSSYIETLNVTLASYNKSTGAQTASEPFSTFFSSLSPANFTDPVIDYNEITGKFAIGILDFHADCGGNPTDSRFDFAISKTSNPSITNPSDWNFHQSTIRPKGRSFFSDYPKMGYNADGFVVSFNMFFLTLGFFDHVSVLPIANDNTYPDGYRGRAHHRCQRYVPTSRLNFTLAPAAEHGSSTGPPCGSWKMAIAAAVAVP